MRDPEDIAYISQLHDEATEAAQEIASLRAEIERLRALCFDLAEMASTLDGADLDDVELIAKGLATGRGEGGA